MNRLTYTQNLTPAQQRGRNALDVTHHALRGVGNTVLAPAKLVDKVLFGGGHVHWIKSRHAQRKDDRPAAGLPRHHGEFVAQTAHIARAQEMLNKAYWIEPAERDAFNEAVVLTANALFLSDKITSDQRDVLVHPDFVKTYSETTAIHRLQQLPPAIHDDFFLELHNQLEARNAYPRPPTAPAIDFGPDHVPRSAFDHGYVPPITSTHSSST